MPEQAPHHQGVQRAGGHDSHTASGDSRLPVRQLHWWEVADALWLTQHHAELTTLGEPRHVPFRQDGTERHPSVAGSGDSVPLPATPQATLPVAGDIEDRTGAAYAVPGRASDEPPTADGSGGEGAFERPAKGGNGEAAGLAAESPFKAPAADPLPVAGNAGWASVNSGVISPGGRAGWLDAAGLGRALRPLRRHKSSSRTPELDEQATAEQLAEQVGLPPVMRPGREPQWDAVLVMDVAPQMDVWRDTAVRLTRVLRHYGNFRDFQIRLLDTYAQTTEGARLCCAGPDRRSQSPGSLVDLTGRRIVFVLTDGLGPAWRSGAAQNMLALWASHQPVAVLQVLPQRLWYRTAVRPERVRLRASGPAPTRFAWEYAEASPAVPAGRRPAAVPILEIASEWLAPWARFLAGQGPRWADLPAVPVTRTGVPLRDAAPESGRPEPDAAQRVAQFQVWASPDAFSLATRLAAAPLDMHTMRSVQRRVLPRTGPVHLAEFLMSDLMEPAPGTASYVFHPGVREELLASSTRWATELASRATAELLAPHSDAARDFLAHLDGRDVPGEPEVTGENYEFRSIEHAVLQALSGVHLGRSRSIGRLLRASNASDRLARVSTRGEPSSGMKKERSVIVTQSGSPEAPVPTGHTGAEEADTVRGGEPVTMASQDTGRGSGVELDRTVRPTLRPAVWGNIPPRNLVFTGREDLLGRLESDLREGPTAVLPHALHGLGGVGKSQLALEYVYRQASQYDIVWWIPAERPTQIAQALVELAQRLRLPVTSEAITAVPAVLEALRIGNPYNKWLLVFDNAESPEAVQDFFPSSPEGGPSGSILVTSRNPQWNTLAHPLEVDVFERSESIQLLQRRNPDLSDEEADLLADVLGDLPLAVEQASAWRAETGMPAAEYLRLFEEKRAELMTVSPPTHYEQTVATAWNVSLDHLASKNPAALQLLQICAYFASEPISRSLFSGAPTEPIAPDLDRALTDPLRLGRAIREINRYSLAKIDHRSNSIQMHRLVQAVLVARMTEDQRERMRRGAHLLLAANAPRDPRDPAHWARFGDLYPHVVVSGAMESDVPSVRQMVIHVSQYLYFWGDHGSAREFGQRAFDTWADKYPDGDQQTLLLCRNLWYVLWRMGRFSDAAELSQRMLRQVQHLGSDTEEELVSTMGQVATDRRASGDFRGAMSIAEEVYGRAVRAFGEDDPLTLVHTHNFAVALRACGLYDRALEIDESTWRRYVLVYGDEAHQSLLSEMGVALDRRELGDYALGARMFEEIVEKFGRGFGESNPHTLRATARLAVSRRKAGDHDAALQLSAQVSKALTERYGVHSPDSLVASLNLSVDLRQTGALEEAVRVGTTTRDLYAEVFGSRHPDTVAADIDLAVTLRLLNDVDSARALNESAMERARAALGDTHPTVLVCAANLASDIFAQGDAAGALEHDERTLALVKDTLGAEHPTSLALMSNISIDLRALHRNADADSMHAMAFEGLRSKLGPSHPACADAAAWRRANCDVDPMP